MIVLSTGAVLDKDLEPGDFKDGRIYNLRVGLCATFIPCRFCSAEKCRRTMYTPCIAEYGRLWTARYTQRTLDGWVRRKYTPTSRAEADRIEEAQR